MTMTQASAVILTQNDVERLLRHREEGGNPLALDACESGKERERNTPWRTKGRALSLFPSLTKKTKKNKVRFSNAAQVTKPIPL